jgi:hypothetical protein
VSYCDDLDQQLSFLDEADDSIVSDTIAPETGEAADERFTQALGALTGGDPLR